MGWWDKTKEYAGDAFNAAGSAGADFYESFYGKPARDQKNAIQTAGEKELGFGQDARDFYSGQNQAIQNDYYGKASADLDAYRRAGGTAPGDTGVAGGPEGGAFSPNGGGSKNSPNLFRLGDEYKNADANKATQQQDFYTQLQATGGPHEQKDYYDYLNGDKANLTNQETLYNQRKDGSDPAAAYMDQRATEGIDRALAARGGYANTAGERQIGDYYANANAQRSQQLAGLAAGADTSRLGKNSALGTAAQGASGEQHSYYDQLGGAAQGASKEKSDFNTYKSDLGKGADQEVSDYFKTLTGSSTALAKAQADTQTELAKAGGQALSQAQIAALQAELAAAGVDPAKQKDFLEFITNMGKTVGEVAAA